MKKSTVKAAKSPIIAKKPAAAAKAPAKVVKKAAPAPVKKAAAPSVKPATKAASTVITALIDIGFGNTLYIRGEGAGLSWDAGVALDCLADDKWSITLPASSKPVTYKLLINDLSWSTGADFVTASGQSVSLTPSF
jgi:hypothetical protein